MKNNPWQKLSKPTLALAPMAGITDLPFRLICKESGADIVYSEMISAAGLFYNGAKSKKLLATIPEEQPVVFQLFGSNPKHFAKAARIITDLTSQPTNKLTGLDINFGCPVKKVIKQSAGCALMKDLKLSRKIIETVIKNTSLPVSLKIRAGMGKVSAIEFLQNIADLNWQTVIVHGRTFEQGFSGLIDFNLIKKIKELFPEKIVIANGGIYSPEEAKKTLEKTDADGLAIATGALGQPWIFKQIKNYLKTGKYCSPDLNEIKKVAIRHANYHRKYNSGDFQEFRKHLGWYFKGLSGIKKVRKRLFEVKDYSDVKNIIDKI